MPKQPTAYYRPKSLDEALALLKQPNTVPLAGGTMLLATEEGLDAAVVDLQDTGLDTLEWSESGGGLVAGAMVRLATLDEFLAALPAAADAAGLLRQAIRQAGPNTYRHAATLGGTIAARLPDSELLAALLALDTTITLQSGRGPETVALTDYLQSPLPGVITHLTFPWQTGRGAAERVARTPADQPIVSVTMWRPAGQMPRLAATGVEPRPARLIEAEAALAGGVDEATIAAAAAAAPAATTHPGDFRGDSAYRAEMAAVLTRRVLRGA